MKKIIFTCLLTLFVCTTAFAELPPGIILGPQMDLELEDPASTTENPVLKVTVPEYTLNADRNITDEFLKYQWQIDNMNADVVWNGFAEGNIAKHQPNHVFLIVIDTGIDLHHEDIDMSNAPYINGLLDKNGVYGVGSAPNAQIQDITMESTVWTKPENIIGTSTYHGTHVAGTAGAAANGKGIVGVAPGITLIPVNRQYVRDENDPEALPTFTPEDHAALTNYVAHELIPWLKDNYEDARIIVNMSYRVDEEGGNGTPSPSYDAYEKLMGMDDVLFTIAAGNDAKELSAYIDELTAAGNYVYPYTYCNPSASNIITVAAHGYNFKWNPASNYGADKVDISAPGMDILLLGTGDDSDSLELQAKSYSFGSGTSFAAPNVAGAAALLWEAFPNATAAQIKQMIVEGAKTTVNQPLYDFYTGKEKEEKITDLVAYGFLDIAAAFRASYYVLGNDSGYLLPIPIKNIAAEVENKTATVTAEGEKIQVTAKVSPINAENKEIVWKTSNPSALSVNEETGEYTAHTVDTPQQVTIWAEPKNPVPGTLAASVKSNMIEIYVNTVEVAVPPYFVHIVNADGEAIDNIQLQPGASVELDAVVDPEENAQGVVWSVDDPSIVEITNVSGKTAIFKALKNGETNIRLASSVASGITDSITVRVSNGSIPTSIALSDSALTLKPGETSNMTVTVLPADADYTLQYRSENPDIAEISNNGIITANSEGKTKITVATDNGLTAECVVTVAKEAVTPAPQPGGSGGGSSGGCNAGYGAFALLAAIPIFICKKKSS